MTVSFSFATRISNLLADSGYKQTDLAKYLGLKSQTVSAWISGRAFPTYDKLESVARFFRMSVPELLGGASESSPSPSLVFVQEEDNLAAIPRGSEVRVEIRTEPEIGDIVLYKNKTEARLLRLAAYRDRISVLMSDTPGDPPVIARDEDREIVGTATAILLKKSKKRTASSCDLEAAPSSGDYDLRNSSSIQKDNNTN